GACPAGDTAASGSPFVPGFSRRQGRLLRESCRCGAIACKQAPTGRADAERSPASRLLRSGSEATTRAGLLPDFLAQATGWTILRTRGHPALARAWTQSITHGRDKQCAACPQAPAPFAPSH